MITAIVSGSWPFLLIDDKAENQNHEIPRTASNIFFFPCFILKILRHMVFLISCSFFSLCKQSPGMITASLSFPHPVHFLSEVPYGSQTTRPVYISKPATHFYVHGFVSFNNRSNLSSGIPIILHKDIFLVLSVRE